MQFLGGITIIVKHRKQYNLIRIIKTAVRKNANSGFDVEDKGISLTIISPYHFPELSKVLPLRIRAEKIRFPAPFVAYPSACRVREAPDRV